MKSRTVQTCEVIVKKLIRERGPFARVGMPIIEKAVIEVAGGDSRTKKRYCEQLVLLDYVRLVDQKCELYSLNWKKVDYAQTSLELVVDEEGEPP